MLLAVAQLFTAQQKEGPTRSTLDPSGAHTRCISMLDTNPFLNIKCPI